MRPRWSQWLWTTRFASEVGTVKRVVVTATMANNSINRRTTDREGMSSTRKSDERGLNNPGSRVKDPWTRLELLEILMHFRRGRTMEHRCCPLCQLTQQPAFYSCLPPSPTLCLSLLHTLSVQVCCNEGLGTFVPRHVLAVETCIFLMGLSLIRAVRSVENKTDERDKRKSTKKKQFLGIASSYYHCIAWSQNTLLIAYYRSVYRIIVLHESAPAAFVFSVAMSPGSELSCQHSSYVQQPRLSLFWFLIWAANWPICCYLAIS